MLKKNSRSYFSVIIPLRELSYVLLFENLPAFDNQTYKKFEVIVLPNDHSQYDISLLKKYKWLRIIPTGKIIKPAEKRNIGVHQAKGNIVTFIDDDAYPKADFLEQASTLFTDKTVAVCGPGILPLNASLWESVFDEVLKSWMGSGEYAYRFTPRKKRFVDDFPSMNFSIKKNIFLKLGGFKGNYWPGEDSKLCEDVAYKERKKILYHPDVIVFHHRRKDLESYLKQHANYGFHRGAFFAHGDKNSLRISYLVPTFFVFYLLFSTVFSVFLLHFSYLLSSNYYLIIIIFYFPLIAYIILALQIFLNSLLNRKNLAIALFSPFVLFTTHVVYGIMFIKGFWKGMRNKDRIYQ
ncbi:hypothetical protein A2866_05465 [Candidatus Roizmanbacteria bacterium RIFCSPHIGHO2_01_FULL_39_8]|uniref:Glycosyltransferase 2-like domain-containing protein n=3 Tax=Candidatus Roizmaniibacteriota TaxID=1752723 RepID=A0A1F7GFX7_9BACT|nr:MAG: hypothetical protein A2866_05465 [Candidatus Roizmanbacteria bacterium RIFCSPHIGHO2_01_FULL_39_8]OGK26578.1 MAG: hypothetical protein A3C28_03670 [Candidatus Roizmanbacteria bacterium RIFCSPHIGHO2_02_FULL_39_9]OGK34677.1 MAG: hypothetical protein A3F60_03415 [Candidatus Roizmanbacteria bacterium RIFCSPHIGHO2_12_FULL_39_8]